MLTFGTRLKYLIQLMGYRQNFFAKLLGISESQLSKLLNDKRKPTVKELNRMVEVLGIPYECLVGRVIVFDRLVSENYQLKEDSLFGKVVLYNINQ